MIKRRDVNMALPGFHYNVVEAKNQTGDASILFKLDFAGASIYGHTPARQRKSALMSWRV